MELGACDLTVFIGCIIDISKGIASLIAQLVSFRIYKILVSTVCYNRVRYNLAVRTYPDILAIVFTAWNPLVLCERSV